MPPRTRLHATRTPTRETGIQGFIRRQREGARAFLAEGDSWFAFPLWLRTNLIEELIKRLGTSTTWLKRQSNGDEAREMMCGPQYTATVKLLQRLKREEVRVDAILFSGGGNDIAGESLLPLLRKFQPGSGWMDCIHHDRFERRLESIANAYHELATLRDEFQPGTPVLTHAYDYAIVSGKPVRVLGLKIGPWIKQHMEGEKGITQPRFQQEIINHMLSRFDDMHTRLEQQLETGSMSARKASSSMPTGRTNCTRQARASENWRTSGRRRSARCRRPPPDPPHDSGGAMRVASLISNWVSLVSLPKSTQPFSLRTTLRKFSSTSTAPSCTVPSRPSFLALATSSAWASLTSSTTFLSTSPMDGACNKVGAFSAAGFVAAMISAPFGMSVVPVGVFYGSFTGCCESSLCVTRMSGWRVPTSLS
ncbi:MAG: hypothetical protein HC841_06580 [Verrucomicrobiae bacterium]|nr:hypothetical protein [Verrucomicrobiae bacterium]